MWWDPTDPWHALLALGDTPVVDAGPLTGLDGTWSSPGWRPTAAGELVLDGLAWLHARAYDPATRSFLSPDPLPPVLGSGWAGNPYAYAGNDPLHALDPLGLSPVTDAQLDAYRDANKPGILKAWDATSDWMGDNWEYVAGGAMVVAGGVLIATGVGGPAGMALVSAGADTVIQKALTGGVNWKQVAVSGALGAVGGAASTSFKALGAAGKTSAALRTSMAVNGGVGAMGGAASYVVGPGEKSWRGFAASTLGGGVAGSIGAVGGPLAGTASRSLSGVREVATRESIEAGLNFGAGVVSYGTTKTLAGDDLTWQGLGTAGTSAVVTGRIAQELHPGPRGTPTLESQAHFGTRTAGGAFNFDKTNTRLMWGSAATGSGLGSLADVAVSSARGEQ